MKTEAQRRAKKKYYKKSQGAENSGKRWDAFNITLALLHNISDSEMAKSMGRSVNAIQIIRHKYKHLDLPKDNIVMAYHIVSNEIGHVE